MTEAIIQKALARFYDPRKNIIVPNVSWSFFNHEVDLLVISKAGYGTEIEIKVSMADLKKDFSKKKHTKVRPKLLSRLFYCVPTAMVDAAKQIVPEQFGIMEYYVPSGQERGFIRVIRGAKKEKTCEVWSQKDQYLILRNLSIKFWNRK